MPVVNPNPNMFRIADVGAAMRSGQDIQAGRLKNEALGLDIQEAKDMIARRDKANEIRSKIDGMPAQIQELEGAGLIQEADQLRDTYIKTRKAEVDIIGAMRAGISAENYDEVKQGMLEEGNITPGLWPDEYSDKWFKDYQAEKKGNLSRLTRQWAQDGAVMSQDMIQQDGEVLWEGQPYESKQGKGGAGGFKYGASDNNAIGSEAAALFGGFYDPASGQFRGLKSGTEQRVTSLREQASKIYQEAGNQGQQITHSMAVARAARKMGISIGNLSEQENVDNVLGLTRPSR